jgi:hypothetical protein
MKFHGVVCSLAILLCGSAVALAQDIPDLKGTWHPTEGAHIVDGESHHAESGTVPVTGHDTAEQHSSKFVFRFEGQDGRTFWGTLASAKVTEKLVGAISVDNKRFVIADHDGTFNGYIIDNDTLDYCYSHIGDDDVAVACGILAREK